MTSSNGISRRTVLVGIGGAATAALVAVAAGVTLADRDASSESGDRTTEDAVIRIGAAYRTAYPDEDDRARLSDALPEFEGQDSATLDDQLAALDERVRQDFADGHVVVVDGWLLARTEARAAALVSMLA